jgi:hypothetical protein
MKRLSTNFMPFGQEPYLVHKNWTKHLLLHAGRHDARDHSRGVAAGALGLNSLPTWLMDTFNVPAIDPAWRVIMCNEA